MSQQDVARDLTVAAGKLAVATGPTAYGVITLNQVGLILGILCSIAVFVQTVLTTWWRWQDRKRTPRS